MNLTAAAPEQIHRWYSSDTTGSLNEWRTYPRMTLQRNKTIFQWLWNIVLTMMEENQTLLRVKQQNTRTGEIWDDHGFNWYVPLFSFSEVQWCFKGNFPAIIMVLDNDGGSKSSEMSQHFCQTTQSHLTTHQSSVQH